MAQIEVADTIAGATELTEGQVFTNDLYNSGDVDYYKLPGTLFAVPSAMDVNFGLGGQNASSSAFKISVISYDGTTETVLTSKSTAVATSRNCLRSAITPAAKDGKTQRKANAPNAGPKTQDWSIARFVVPSFLAACNSPSV